MRSRHAVASAFACLLSTMHAVAQIAPAPAPAPAPASGATDRPACQAVHLRWPDDKDTAVAAIGGKPLTLAALVDHLSERHHPGLRAAFDDPERAEVHRILQSDLIAQWVRHFADVQALRAEAATRKLDAAQAEASCAAALKTSFEDWLQGYVDNLKQQGHPTGLSQQRVNALLTDFQLRQGLACEVQGWLDFLEPDTYTKARLNEFYQSHPRYFGGQVTFAHILIQHRDPGTGILLDERGRGEALARLGEVRARVQADGSNFAELAKLFSDDTRTAPKGGLIERVHRFDDRLPAILCRTVWGLRDGETSDVVESQYGFHILHRIEFNQKQFMLFTDGALPTVRMVMRRAMQEDLLFDVRRRHQIELRL